MILKALEMQGFKSFPEKTTLTFGKGITAVVGPNGSGKSNISDAVRWVLGEQSSKSLRGSKMEDVIFDGTKIRKAYGFAQVTLRLDNSDRSIASVDSDEVAVTRRYFRSGESEYKINGQNVRLRDVNELFMDTGLGRDGYSMVGQGKISEMISGKGNQCREMLEEAAGISAYRYRRSDSLKRLAAAQDNLLRLKDILSELEGRIGPLKMQSEKAEKFLLLSAERKTLEISLWLYNIERLRDELIKQDDKIIIATGQYDSAQSELEKIEKQIEQSYSASQEITTSIDNIRNKISENERQSSEYLSQSAVLQNSIEHNKATIERIKKEKESALASRTQLEKEIAGEEKLISQIKAIEKSKQESLNAVMRELEEMKSKGGSLQTQEGELTAKAATLAKLISDSTVEYSTLKSSLDEISLRLCTIEEQLEQKNQNALLLKQKQEEASSLYDEGCDNVVELTNKVQGLTKIFEGHEAKLDELKKKIDEKNFESQHLRSKTAMLEDLEKNMEGYSGAVKAVIRESERGNLFGIEGTVSKLVTMKSEYALAIETALGGAVQNIVCQNENNAKKAIEFLKSKRLGRATFQPISSVRGRSIDERGLESCDGFVGFADELTVCDEKYREIVSSLLGKTVVATDLDYAVSIAKKYKYRFKIVTLDGQVVNAGGSITGGSQTKNAGIISRGLEIEKLHEKYESQKNELDEMTKEYQELSLSLSTEEETLLKTKNLLADANEQKLRLSAQKELALSQLHAVSQNLDELENEKKACRERSAQLELDLEKAKKLKEDYERQSGECQSGLEALGQKKEQMNRSSEEISQKMSSLRLELHDARKDSDVRTQSMNMLKARLIESENKDAELQNEINSIAQNNLDLGARIKNLQIQAKNLSNHCQMMKGDIESLQKERSQNEAENGKLRAKQKELNSQCELAGGEKARLQERRNNMQEEYETTINKLFDEYSLTLRQAQEETQKASDPASSRRRLGEIKNKIRALGSVNVGAIDEYKEVSERYEFMSSQLADVEKSKRELTRLIDELTDKMSTQFREKFTQINGFFGQTFKELFGGGSAQIALVDPTDVLESDIDITLQPPGKNVKRLDSLSGGEKGLSAISLLFAILKVNPAPFCIFDEVEAALDDVNVSRYAQYVRTMAQNTQFILITHRRGTMEEADMLYGITMQEQGVSKLLELKTAELASKLSLTN